MTIFAMLALSALLSFGGPSDSPLNATVWAGVPLEQLDALGLQNPVLDSYVSGWQAGIQTGGFVRATLHPTLDAARQDFAVQAQAAATRIMEPFASTGLLHDGIEVEAVGDGKDILVFRDRNVVFVVRDLQGDALGFARRIQGALTSNAPQGVSQERKVAGSTVLWDSCGWRRVETRPGER